MRSIRSRWARWCREPVSPSGSPHRCVISKEKPIHSGGVGQDFTNGVIIAGVIISILMAILGINELVF